MASSGNVGTGSLGSYFWIDVTETSTDFAGNTSVLRVVGTIYNNSTSTSFNNGAIKRYININGSEVWTSSPSISVPGKTSQVLFDQSFTIGHDGNGNATVNVTGGFNATGTSGLGGPTSASVNGLGLTRLAAAPNAPTTTITGVTSSSAIVNVTSGGSNRDGTDWYGAWVATDPGFTNIVASASGGTFTATGLARATTYYARSQAHSATYGYSAYSGTVTFTTAATVPDGMAAPTVSNIQPDGATFTWTAPNNGGSAITGYTLQVSTTSDFSSGVTQYTPSASPYAVTGLTPGTTYYARMLASNAVGPSGSWSPSASFSTLSGADTKVSGVWHHAKGFTRVSGVWHQTKTWKKAGGTWHL